MEWEKTDASTSTSVGSTMATAVQKQFVKIIMEDHLASVRGDNEAGAPAFIPVTRKQRKTVKIGTLSVTDSMDIQLQGARDKLLKTKNNHPTIALAPQMQNVVRSREKK